MYNYCIKCNSKEDRFYGSTNVLEQILQSATLLEDLTLMFRDYCQIHGDLLSAPDIPIFTFKGSNTLNHLRNLRLANFKIDAQELVNFLLSVSNTLVALKFDGVIVGNGTWFSVFEQLRGRLAVLNDFEVHP